MTQVVSHAADQLLYQHPHLSNSPSMVYVSMHIITGNLAAGPVEIERCWKGSGELTATKRRLLNRAGSGIIKH